MHRNLRRLSLRAQSPGRRVVVTGMGLVTSLGVGVQHVWKRLCDGASGIQALTEPGTDSHTCCNSTSHLSFQQLQSRFVYIFVEYEKIPCKVGGRIPRGKEEGQLDLEKHFNKGDLRNLFDGSCYAVVAAEEALNMAEWKPTTDEERCRTGKSIEKSMALILGFNPFMD